MSAHHRTSHCITWHDTTQAITSHQMTWPPHQMTWHASKQVTSPPWNSRRQVHSKEMVWASRWSVALRTFYRQILSLAYSFFLLKLPPPACPALLVNLYRDISKEDLGWGSWGILYRAAWKLLFLCLWIFELYYADSKMRADPEPITR